MKLFRSTSILMNGILVAGMLGACQNEKDIPVIPQESANTSDQNARTNLATGTLLKDGNIEFTYNGQNQVAKEGISVNTYSDFIYAPQLITAKMLLNGKASECKYTLDASGRCIQTVSNAGTFIYEYTPSGQLSKFYNKNNPNERREFIYSVDPNGWKKSLSMITFYEPSGMKSKELKFGYGAVAGLLPDKCPLAPNAMPADVSRYLPVFGTFNTYLVKALVEDKYSSNGQKLSSTSYQYLYTLDYTGKAKNITVKTSNGTFVSSTDRKYFAPSYNF